MVYLGLHPSIIHHPSIHPSTHHGFVTTRQNPLPDIEESNKHFQTCSAPPSSHYLQQAKPDAQMEGKTMLLTIYAASKAKCGNACLPSRISARQAPVVVNERALVSSIHSIGALGLLIAINIFHPAVRATFHHQDRQLPGSPYRGFLARWTRKEKKWKTVAKAAPQERNCLAEFNIV